MVSVRHLANLSIGTMTFDLWMTLEGHSNNIIFKSVSIFRMVQEKHLIAVIGAKNLCTLS